MIVKCSPTDLTLLGKGFKIAIEVKYTTIKKMRCLNIEKLHNKSGKIRNITN